MLKESGIKSARTLDRWQKRGIIPPPLKVDVSPSGRGKTAYWSDETLKKVLQIMNYRRQGHSLKSALHKIEGDKVERLFSTVKELKDATKAMKEKTIPFKNGSKLSRLDLLRSQALQVIRRLVKDRRTQAAILKQMLREEIIKHTLILFAGGYNVVLVWDGKSLIATADFFVSHMLSLNAEEGNGIIVIPIFGPLWQIFKLFGGEFPRMPTIRPRPQILKDEGEDVIRYNIAIRGEIFKVYWDFPKVKESDRKKTRTTE
jgi:hypothetical protein